MIMRSTWPFSVSRARPPRPSAPALLDTAVSEWRDSGPRFRSAVISVAVFFANQQSASPSVTQPVLPVWNSQATPQSPKPELSTTEPLLMSATAASALSQTFDPPAGTSADLQWLDCEKALIPEGKLLSFVLGVVLVDLAALAAPLKPLKPPNPRAATARSCNCREHPATTGAACPTARAAPAILSLFRA